MLSSSESNSDDAEWQKSKRRRLKQKNRHIQEEGEVSSGSMDEGEEDVWDENLVGGEEDKERLAKMSEKEREEELFKRAEKRDAMMLRKAFMKKYKQKKEKEKAEKSKSASKSSKVSRKSTYSNVFGSDSDDVDVSDNDFTPAKSKQRKLALEKSKGTTEVLKELVELRKQQQKRSQIITEKETKRSKQDNASLDNDEPKSKKDKRRAGVKLIYSSDSSDSEQANIEEVTVLKSDNIRRASSSSSLSSAISSSEESSDDEHRGRSRSPEEETVSSVDQLSKLRLSRHKLEKWVHMPFFNSLVSGCFVRINIGLSQGVPIYRCLEIVDVVEGGKVYELGNTRTNKVLVVRASKHQNTMRMAFVSNTDFTQSEFDSWYRRMREDGHRPPTLQFVQRKSREIEQSMNVAITDEQTVEQIVQSKRRFQRAPTNYAMRKAELIKQKEIAELETNTSEVKRLESELKEIDTQAEKIERKRTVGFKSIKTINQRNRLLSVQQVEEAIKREAIEDANAPDGDTFTRIQSRPVIWTKKNFNLLKNKQSEDQVDGNSLLKNDTDSGSKMTPKLSDPGSISLIKTPLQASRSLHDIHNFDIDISVELGLGASGAGSNSVKNLHDVTHNGLNENSSSLSGSVNHNHILSSNTSTISPNVINNPSVKQTPINRRMLNLEEYKRSRGLI